MQMNAGGHSLSIAALSPAIFPQEVRKATGVTVSARGARAIPGVVFEYISNTFAYIWRINTFPYI